MAPCNWLHQSKERFEDQIRGKMSMSSLVLLAHNCRDQLVGSFTDVVQPYEAKKCFNVLL